MDLHKFTTARQIQLAFYKYQLTPSEFFQALDILRNKRKRRGKHGQENNSAHGSL